MLGGIPYELRHGFLYFIYIKHKNDMHAPAHSRSYIDCLAFDIADIIYLMDF